MVVRRSVFFTLSGAHTRTVAKCRLPLVPHAVETVEQVAAFVGRHADALHPTLHGAPYLQHLPNANMTAFFTHFSKKINARSNKARRSRPC